MFVCLSWYSFLNSSSAQVPLKIKLWNYIVVSLNTFTGISLSFSKDFKSDRVNYIFFWFSLFHFLFKKLFWNWLSTENFTVFIISFLKFTTRENSDSWPLVSSGVATLKSSEELSTITNITITFKLTKYFCCFLIWNIFAWKKGTVESLDLNYQGDIFLYSDSSVDWKPGLAPHLHLGFVS